MCFAKIPFMFQHYSFIPEFCLGMQAVVEGTMERRDGAELVSPVFNDQAESPN